MVRAGPGWSQGVRWCVVAGARTWLEGRADTVSRVRRLRRMLGLLGGGRFGGGDLQGDGRTAVRLGADVQGAGVDGEPVGDVGQAGAVVGGGRVVAVSGVGDRNDQGGAIVAGGDGDTGVGACVFGGVVERFQAAEVDGCLDLGWVAADAVEAHGGGQAGLGRGGGQGGGQAVGGQHGWVDAAGEAADLADRALELVSQITQQDSRAAGVGLGGAAGQPQGDRGGDQVLLGAVVQVAFDAPAFGVGGGGQPVTGGG